MKDFNLHITARKNLKNQFNLHHKTYTSSD